jgi:hypothetical protein
MANPEWVIVDSPFPWERKDVRHKPHVCREVITHSVNFLGIPGAFVARTEIILHPAYYVIVDRFHVRIL